MTTVNNCWRTSVPKWIFPILFSFLFLTPSLQAGVVITEFMAANSGFLKDQDGENSDWIELHNDSFDSVNLQGWHLTDDINALAKWTFPATNLPAGGYLVVFASDKNRAVAGAELHTNFKLGAEGEYLGLIMPDNTVASAFAPAFPAQVSNRSFGVGRETISTPLIIAGAAGKVFVPTNSALGTNWTSLAFNDSSWTSATTGIGFDTFRGSLSYPSGNLPVLSIDFNDDDSGETGIANIERDFGASMTLSNNPATFGASPAHNGFPAIPGITVALSAIGGGVLDDRDRTTPTDSGAFTLDQIYDDFIFVNGLTNGNGMKIQISGLEPEQDYSLKVWSFDSSSGGDRASQWFETASGVTNILISPYIFDGVVLPLEDDDNTFIAPVKSSPSGALTIEARRSGGVSHGVFLNALQLTELGFGSLIKRDISLMMSNKNASAFLRLPFNISNPTNISSLLLKMKYDDGFVAFINGQQIASRNAPDPLAWNSAATASRDNTNAVVFEEIPVAIPTGLLQMGTNILAIQGLNRSTNDDDFLILPELESIVTHEYADRYFTVPTPGVGNNFGALGILENPEFSVQRGFFNAPFSVTLSTITPDTQIRWTTNNSTPSLTNGAIYTAPLQITNTTVLRAAVFKADYAPSETVTHTYIFMESVLRQSNTQPGLPTSWQASYPADYGMDSNVVNHPVYGATIRDDLRAIPTLSLVMDFDSLWGSANGIYNHSTSQDGELWERAGSVELIGANGLTQFAVNCGIRAQGNASRDNLRTPKHSFRLLFKGDYGPSKLEYKWFPTTTVDEFDNIVLRACFTDSWATRYSPGDNGQRYRPEDALYLRDVWVKDTFAEMGHLSGSGSHVHLYVNGLYWGLYNPTERLDNSFFVEHIGGAEEAWDIIRDFSEVLDGNKMDWDAMMSIVNAGITNETAYQAVRDLVDVPNLIDYMALHIFGEAEDWPGHNWYAAHRRATNGLPATKWIFLPWDQEITEDQDFVRNQINVSNDDTPARIYSQLRAWPEFRREFGDRLQKHLFNGGALTPGNNVLRFAMRANSISNAIVGESARWGDAREFDTPGSVGTGQTFTRDEWWTPELQKLLTNWFPNQQAVAIARFRAGNLYPALDAPQFSQFGGAVSSGFQLTITHPNSAGAIYYTLDGSDPRSYGSGTISSNAIAYSAPFSLPGSGTIRARVLNGTNWSALVDASFQVPVDWSKLQLSELFYNPPKVGSTDGDEYEFLELRNIGEEMLNLSGLQFTNGIVFAFTNGTTLAPGAYFVMVRNPTVFTTRFMNAPANGIYTGKLDNSGEQLSLTTASGQLVFQVTFGSATPWPDIQKTNSLQRINTLTSYGTLNWGAAVPTPGAPPPASIIDSDNDVMPDAYEIAHGLNWQLNDATGDLDGDGVSNFQEFQLKTNPEIPDNFFRLGVNRNTNDANSIILDFYKQTGRGYIIQATTTLSPPAWTNVFMLSATNSGPVQTTNSISTTTKFFKLTVTTAF